MPEPAFLRQFDLQTCTETEPANMALHRNRRTKTFDADGKLIGLNLCGCGVRDLAFLQLSDCQHLQALNLSENPGLTRIQIPAALRHLRHLNVSENPALTELQFEAGLPALETLLADQCQLRALRLPSGFAALRKLDCRQNQLAQVDFEEGCPALEFLDLSQNKLRGLRLPGAFPDLKYLYLNGNQLRSLVLETPAEKLEILHLRDNKLEALPDNLLFFSKLKTLYLHGNPLPNIPKGASGVPEGERDNAAASIRNYLRSISEDKPIPNDEVKLVLLGNSTAGKSSLLRYLMEGKFDEKLSSTHGIFNVLWHNAGLPFKINIWDFGGQEFYHATHRLFLSNNAVVLVAFEQATNAQGEKELLIRLYDDRKMIEKTMPIEVFPHTYWLENLRWFCRGEQVAMLLQTKMDIGEVVDVAADTKKYKLPEDTPRVSVRDAHAGNEEAQDNFKFFKNKLFAALKKAIGKYPFSEKWLLIKNEIRALPDADKTLDYDSYVRFCEKLRPGISRPEPGQQISMLDTLTDYLHETGVVLFYRDNEYEELRKTVFVKPKWVAETIYKVLDYKVMRDGGKFDRAHAARVAPDFDTDQLLALMQKFRLIFPVGNEADTYVAPQYLPDADPQQQRGSLFSDLADACCHTCFVLRFPGFLPRSVLTRFICQYGPLAAGKYWKNGIIFSKEGGFWWVHRSATLEITVRSNSHAPASAHEIFANLLALADNNPDILVSANGSDFAKLADLHNPPPSGDLPNQIPDRAPKWLTIKDFAAFWAVEVHDVNQKQPEKMFKPKIFISYAHSDETYKDELVKHLTTLKDQNLIEYWHDRKIESGLWDPQIEKAMEEADIFLLLVSSNFVASRYISEREITTAYEKFKIGKAKIFPVICNYCANWQLKPLSHTDKAIYKNREMNVCLGMFQAFPKDAKPIFKWRNKQEAYASVVEKLTDEILKML